MDLLQAIKMLHPLYWSWWLTGLLTLGGFYLSYLSSSRAYKKYLIKNTGRVFIPFNALLSSSSGLFLMLVINTNLIFYLMFCIWAPYMTIRKMYYNMGYDSVKIEHTGNQHDR